jgi:hypothetical protein
VNITARLRLALLEGVLGRAESVMAQGVCRETFSWLVRRDRWCGMRTGGSSTHALVGARDAASASTSPLSAGDVWRFIRSRALRVEFR